MKFQKFLNKISKRHFWNHGHEICRKFFTRLRENDCRHEPKHRRNRDKACFLGPHVIHTSYNVKVRTAKASTKNKAKNTRKNLLS